MLTFCASTKHQSDFCIHKDSSASVSLGIDVAQEATQGLSVLGIAHGGERYRLCPALHNVEVALSEMT